MIIKNIRWRCHHKIIIIGFSFKFPHKHRFRNLYKHRFRKPSFLTSIETRPNSCLPACSSVVPVFSCRAQPGSVGFWLAGRRCSESLAPARVCLCVCVCARVCILSSFYSQFLFLDTPPWILDPPPRPSRQTPCFSTTSTVPRHPIFFLCNSPLLSLPSPFPYPLTFCISTGCEAGKASLTLFARPPCYIACCIMWKISLLRCRA